MDKHDMMLGVVDGPVLEINQDTIHAGRFGVADNFYAARVAN